MSALLSVRDLHVTFVTPDRTHVISPTHRVFTIHEKIAMGDGRADVPTLTKAIESFAKDAALDATMRQRFGTTLAAAARGELFAWRSTPADLLSWARSFRFRPPASNRLIICFA